jgi:hypothetical protein
MRTSTRLLGIVILAAAEVGVHAQNLPSIFAAPAAGVSAAKLPDIKGLHLAMTQEEAVAIIKSLYPANAIRMDSSKQADGTVRITTIKTGQDCNPVCDTINVAINYPPNPAHVVGISRTVKSDPSHRPTVDTVVASLRQKYGQELHSPGTGPTLLAWEWDENGQLINPSGPSNWSPADCAGVSVSPPGGVTVADMIPHYTRDLCSRNVYLRVQLVTLNVSGLQVVDQIYMSLAEQSMATRDAIAAQQAVEDANAAKQKQQLKNAQQQKAPSL